MTQKFTAPLAMHLPETLHEQVRRNHELKIIELQKAVESLLKTTATTTGVPTTRLINTTAPLTGGGALSADLTLAVGTFGAAASGVVPSSGGGTTNFLRADATWAAVTRLGAGLYGDGSDGALNFDGTSTVTLGGGGSLVPSGGVYTLTRDIFATTIVSTATVKTAGYRVYASVSLSGGTYHNNGSDASGATGGAAASGGFIGGGGAGGNGAVMAGAPTGGGTTSHQPKEFTSGHANGGLHSDGANGGLGQGGGGGDNSGGGGGTGGDVNYTTSIQATRDVFCALQGHGIGDSAALGGGTGGGGGNGSGSGTDTSGGGGGGGGWIVVAARSISGATVQAKGGAGAGGVLNNGGGGGGGGGGVVVVLTDSTTAPTISVAGGLGGLGLGTGFKGGNGGSGLSIVYLGAA